MTKNIDNLTPDQILSKEYPSKILPRDLGKENLLVPLGNYKLENNPNKTFTPADEEKLRQKTEANHRRVKREIYMYNIKNNLKNYFSNSLYNIKKYFSKKQVSDFL